MITPNPATALKLADVSAPQCEEPANLDVSEDSFVPLANDLAGVTVLNDAIRTYARKEWNALFPKLQSFRKEYERSPLMEVAAFLDVQAHFDIASAQSGEEKLKEAEQRFREASLLYPKSDLIPVLEATMANYYLARGRFEKSLPLYEAARTNYPFHPLYCVFQMGVAESQLRLKNIEGASRHFQQLLQKCRNARLRLGAELRLKDIERSTSKNFSPGKYVELVETHARMVNNFYPSVLFDLGELHYGKKEYQRARFYYSEYQKWGKSSIPCRAWASLRLGDVGLRLNEKPEPVGGLYLVTYDENRNSDVGNYAHVQALLVGMADIGTAERQRRITLIDESADKIRDEALKRIVFLKKGLVLLELGDENALDYLLRLESRESVGVLRSPILEFVRERAVLSLQQRAKALDPSDENGVAKARKWLNQSEEIYGKWLKESPLQATLKNTYRTTALAYVRALLEDGSIKETVNFFEKWKRSPLWIEDAKSKGISREIAGQLIKNFYVEEPPNFSEQLKEEKDRMGSVLGKDADLLWAIANFEWNGEIKPTFKSGDLGNLPSDVESYVQFGIGRVLNHMGQFTEAAKYLSKVKAPELKERVLEEKLHAFKKTKNYEKAFQLVLGRMEKKDTEKQKQLLVEAAGLVKMGKLWKSAPALLKKSQEYGFQKADLAPYQYLTGKAWYELNRCNNAIPQFEAALIHLPQADESLEARFQLGKCLARSKKTQAAIEVWKQLASQKDPFWSSLAKNEIKLNSPR